MAKLLESGRLSYKTSRRSIPEDVLLDLLKALSESGDGPATANLYYRHLAWQQFKYPADLPELDVRSDRGELDHFQITVQGAGANNISVTATPRQGTVNLSMTRCTEDVMSSVSKAVQEALPESSDRTEDEAKSLGDLVERLSKELALAEEMSIRDVLGQIQDTHNAITSLRGKADSALGELLDFKKSAAKAAAQVDASKTSAEQSREEADAARHSLIDLLQQAEKQRETLDEIETFVTETRQRVAETYGLAAGATLRSTFAQQSRKLERQSYIWIGAFTLLLVAVALIAWEHSADHLDVEGWIARAFVALPVILLEGFFVSQYRRSQKMADEYAFRAAVSSTFPAYKDEIRQQSDNPAVAKFVQDAVGRIYAPLEDTGGISRAQRKEIERLLELARKVSATGLGMGSTAAQAALNEAAKAAVKQTD